MAIRINLLAEAQALEEMRRRDPVKRTVWVAVLLGVLLLLWSAYLQTRIMTGKHELAQINKRLGENNKEYNKVMENKKKLDEANAKLRALYQLATNRFLNGTLLDVLQHSTVDEVALAHLKTEHTFTPIEEAKARTNQFGKLIPAKPAMISEKIVLTLDARDNTDGQYAIKFKDNLADNPYVQAVLGKTNEVAMKNITQGLLDAGRKYATFNLELRYPERMR